MCKESQPLELDVGHWYAWEMLPGYINGRYYSPIRVERIQPQRTGRDILRLDFYNMCYAEGVRGFSQDLKILHRGPGYILANLLDEHSTRTNRSALITTITHSWLRVHFPNATCFESISYSASIEEIERLLDSLD